MIGELISEKYWFFVDECDYKIQEFLLLVTLEWNFKIEFYILEKEGRICEANGELKHFDELWRFTKKILFHFSIFFVFLFSLALQCPVYANGQ